MVKAELKNFGMECPVVISLIVALSFKDVVSCSSLFWKLISRLFHNII